MYGNMKLSHTTSLTVFFDPRNKAIRIFSYTLYIFLGQQEPSMSVTPKCIPKTEYWCTRGT